MAKYWSFGEHVDGYGIPVFNEREVRASAGILFFFAIVSFINAWLIGYFEPTKLFVIAFLIEFSIRIFFNPKFAPSMILGRWIVSRQKPEYVGAPQKRWAWSIGFTLAIIMFYLVVLNNIKGPINLVICSLCLALLFFEAAFGICLGCKIYNLFHARKALYCFGEGCEVSKKEEIQKISLAQSIVLIGFIAGIIALTQYTPSTTKEPFVVPITPLETQKLSTPKSAQECEPPQWAIDMGHGEKWKLHHGCL